MDWNRVFDETGEEEGEWQELDITSTRTGILQHLEHYSPFICYCFTVNYILGVGCLGIPYAFQKSGILQSSIIMIVISFVSYLTVLFVAEASYRGIQIKIDKSTNNPFKSPKISTITTNNKVNNNNNNITRSNILINTNTSTSTIGISATNYGSVLKLSNLNISSSMNNGNSNSSNSNNGNNNYTLLTSANPISSSSSSSSSSSFTNNHREGNLKSIENIESNLHPHHHHHHYHKIKNRGSNTHNNNNNNNNNNSNTHHTATANDNDDDDQSNHQEVELTILTSEFLGKPGKYIYQISVMGLSYIGLLAYTQVFNASFHSQICSQCNDYIPVLLFSSIVIPLSLLDLNEQITVQFIMSFLRFLSLGLLIMGTIIAIFTTDYYLMQQTDPMAAASLLSPSSSSAVLSSISSVSALSSAASSLVSPSLVASSSSAVTGASSSSSSSFVSSLVSSLSAVVGAIGIDIGMSYYSNDDTNIRHNHINHATYAAHTVTTTSSSASASTTASTTSASTPAITTTTPTITNPIITTTTTTTNPATITTTSTSSATTASSTSSTTTTTTLFQHIYIHTPIFININNFGMIFTTSIFAQLFQHSVPGLIRPLAHHDKKNIKNIFFYAILTTTMIYLIMGITCTLYFGDQIAESINLNFVNFTWGVTEDHPTLYALIQICSMIIVLFPAVDTLSVFPLIANTLGNNLNVSFPLLKQYICSYYQLSSLDCKRYHIEKHIILFWRLVAAIPPILLSFVVKDLAFSMQLAGIFGIFLALIIPSLLQIYSQKHDAAYHNITYQLTPYSNYFSQSYVSSYVILMIAVVALSICVCQIFKYT